MVRIIVSKQNQETVVAIDGHLVALDLEELKRVRQSNPNAVILSLESLISADAESLIELHGWISDGAQIQGASHYMKMLLEQVADTGKSEGEHE